MFSDLFAMLDFILKITAFASYHSGLGIHLLMMNGGTRDLASMHACMHTDSHTERSFHLQFLRVILSCCSKPISFLLSTDITN